MGLKEIAENWPDGDFTQVPYGVYSDAAVFQQEMERIFCGKSWAYVGLAEEIPNPADFKTTMIGNRSVVICRDKNGQINGFVNRCAHRGAKFCREKFGNQTAG